MPIPIPPVGGIPCSSASMNASSYGCVSSSPAPASARCSSNRRRCSSGSFSSVNAFAISIPPTYASNRSTSPGIERWRLANGDSVTG